MATLLHPLPPPPTSDDDWDTFWTSYKTACNSQQLATIAKQDVCLVAYEQQGTLKAGVEACGLTYAAASFWMQNNTHHFRRRLAFAQNIHADKMEALMYERLEEPKGNRGSDPLLMFALKGERPDKWRELPVIIASDTSREIQEKLVKMVSEGMKRRQAAITVTAEAPEERVQRMLGPSVPDVTEEQPPS